MSPAGGPAGKGHVYTPGCGAATMSSATVAGREGAT